MESSLLLKMTKFSVSCSVYNLWVDTEADIVIYYKTNIVDRKQAIIQSEPTLEQAEHPQNESISEPEVLL